MRPAEKADQNPTFSNRPDAQAARASMARAMLARDDDHNVGAR